MNRGEKKRTLKIVIAAAIVVAFLALIYITFFYFRECENRTCFYDQMAACDRAIFTGKGGNNSFEYKIIGQSGSDCRIDVKMVAADLNNQDALKLVGKEMACAFPVGVVADPENQIDKCHGLLKEGLQDLIISKMHRYIVQNLGTINADLSKAL